MSEEFKAKIEGIHLDTASKERIAKGIQKLVLQELALVDNKGDLVIKRPFRLGPTNGIIAVEKGGVITVSSLS